MHEKVRIYVNSAGQERYKRQASVLNSQLADSTLRNLTFPLEIIPDEVETVIVAGGDGSVKGVTEMLLRRENSGLLLIVPAGSQNGLHTALVDKKSQLTVKELQDKAINHIPRFNPGSINGEVFVYLADITKAGVLQLRYAETMRRYVPRKIRAYAGFTVASVVIKKDNDYPDYGFHMFMTTPYFGATKAYPAQDLYEDSVTLVSLQAENKVEGAAKMGIFLFYMLMRKTPPKTVAEITSQKSFATKTYSSKINVDGEERTLPEAGTVFVKRDKRSLQVAALSLK